MQVAPLVAGEPGRPVVVTVCSFCFRAQDEVVGVEVLHARHVLGSSGTPFAALHDLLGRPASG